MRAMKDSGIEWIGEIPEGWGINKIKTHFSVVCGATPSDSPVNWSGDIPWIGPADMCDWGYISAGSRSLTVKGYESCGTSLVPAGTLILSTRAPIGKIQISSQSLCTNQGCKALVKKSNNAVTMYLAYYLFAIREQLEEAGTGTTFRELATSALKNMPIVFPPPAEQQRIAAYLDKQCGEIDKVLAKTRESIEEYKKLKQSVITEAVTKGIRPDRPMKPSGIEWIGEIPEEWEVRPFRTILTERNEKNLPAKTEERLSLSIDLGVTKYAEKTTNLDRFKEDVTQYKLAYPGDLVMNSMNMIVGAVGVSPYFGCVSPAYYTYYDKSSSGVAARFCDFLFRTRIMRRVLRSLGKGIYSIERGDDRVNTCRLKVAREDLRALKIPLPSATEQTEIVAYLDQQCAEIDRLIARKEQIITELESYKKSLIYECVTGKREVV